MHHRKNTRFYNTEENNREKPRDYKQFYHRVVRAYRNYYSALKESLYGSDIYLRVEEQTELQQSLCPCRGILLFLLISVLCILSIFGIIIYSRSDHSYSYK